MKGDHSAVEIVVAVAISINVVHGGFEFSKQTYSSYSIWVSNTSNMLLIYVSTVSVGAKFIQIVDHLLLLHHVLTVHLVSESQTFLLLSSTS